MQCMRPSKHPVVDGGNGAGEAQAADGARQGVSVAPAWSLASAAGVSSATFWLVPEFGPRTQWLNMNSLEFSRAQKMSSSTCWRASPASATA